jgi:membrane associated rhomboid family serine protease
LPGGDERLVEQFANWSPAILEGGEVYRLITYGFLQVGFTHLLINLLFLAYVGWNIERGLGRINLLCIFVFCILCGGVLSLLMSPGRPSLGSSGGDFGLLAAAVVFGWKHGELIPDNARKFFGWGVLPYLVLTLSLGLRSHGVDNWGHFGGLVGGGMMATLLDPDAFRAHRRSNRILRRSALVLSTGFLVVLAWRGPHILRLNHTVEAGLYSSHPSGWKEAWAYGGDRGWASPTGRATLVAKTAVYGRPLDLGEATQAVLNQLDAWASAPVVLRREPIWVGEYEALRLRVAFEDAGKPQEMEALLIPRGRLLHRVQLFSEEAWAWRYRGLSEALFSEVEIRVPPELQLLRQLLANDQSDPTVYVQLGDAAAMSGYGPEARKAYENALSLGDSEDRARATEGLLMLFRDTGMDAQPETIRAMAAEFHADVPIQIAAAEALEGKGDRELAREVLLSAGRENAADFALRRALAERRLPIPELDSVKPSLELPTGHGERLP